MIMEQMLQSVEDILLAFFAGMSGLAALFIVLVSVVIGLLITFFVRVMIAYWMARNRNRDPWGWVLLSFCFSPLLTWIVLLLIGDADAKK